MCARPRERGESEGGREGECPPTYLPTNGTILVATVVRSKTTVLLLHQVADPQLCRLDNWLLDRELKCNWRNWRNRGNRGGRRLKQNAHQPTHVYVRPRRTNGMYAHVYYQHQRYGTRYHWYVHVYRKRSGASCRTHGTLASTRTWYAD